jgi:hypothetical protein
MAASPNKNDISRFGIYYKLRHIPSGLFYIPNFYRTLCNLSKFGKLYNSIPSDLREGKYSFFYDENNVKRIISLEDWEIVKIELKEIDVLNYANEINRKSSNKSSE